MKTLPFRGRGWINREYGLLTQCDPSQLPEAELTRRGRRQ